MRGSTGPGRILDQTSANGKGRSALLYNFDIDDSHVKSEHQDWLMKNVVPLLTRARRFTVSLRGTARRGGAGFNADISQRRVEAMEGFLKANGIRPEQLTRSWVGESESPAFGRLDGGESEEDRSVAVFVAGPDPDVPKFICRNWWEGDSADPLTQIIAEEVAFNTTAQTRIVLGEGWNLFASNPGLVYFIDPDTNRRIDEYPLGSNDEVITLAGFLPGLAQILGEDIFGEVRPLLDVTILP